MEQTFITYVRTMMLFELRFMGSEKGLKPVHIPSGEVQDILGMGHRQKLDALVRADELEVLRKPLPNGHSKYYYAVKKAGAVDFNRLPKKSLPKDAVSKRMMEHLRHTTLPAGTAATPYWDAFVKWRNSRMDLFVKYDSFGYRFHSPVTSLHKAIRPHLLLYGQHTSSIDIVQSQPTILAHILKNAIGDNEFTAWIENGIDVYAMLQEKAGLETREDAKTKFFEIAFGKPSQKLAETYGNATWVEFVNGIKKQPLKTNPNTKFNRDGSRSHHNNLAMLLQRTESGITRKVWAALVDAGIPFLTVHDEIVTKSRDMHDAQAIINAVLGEYLPMAKTSLKSQPVALNTPNLSSPLSDGERQLYNVLNELHGIAPETAGIVAGVEVGNVRRTISEVWEGYAITRGRTGNETWKNHIQGVLKQINN